MNIQDHQTTWHIAGIGALGTLVAGNFCQAGHSVKLILKDTRRLLTYQHSQLEVIHDKGVFTCHPDAITLDQLGTEPINQLICCTKAYDVTPFLTQLKNNLNENSIIILIHNGLGVLEEIQDQLPHLRIILGISKLGAYLEKPFTTRAILNNKLHLGIAHGHFTQEEIDYLNATFKKTRLPYQWEEDIHFIRWEKFAINCSMNILTALFNCINGDLLQHETLLKAMTQEISQVMTAYNIKTSMHDLWQQVRQITHDTADNYSSMYQDVQQHRKTEIAYLNAQLVKLAQRKQIAIPVNNEILNQFYIKFPQQKDNLN